MLGLGLALSVAKGVIDEIGGLLSKLARRSTYSENLADSRAVVSDIDSYDLLDKATILLTPTATSNARVHSVKTYTGDELLTNGGFDSDSDWTKLNATISGGKGNLDGDGQTALLYQGILTNGKTYKATFTVSDYNNLGEARIIDDNGATKYTITSDGTFTVYFTHNIATSNFLFRAKNGAVYSIDNVSVTEADADFDFDRASSATRINSDGLVQDMQSITDPELVLNGDFEELGNEEVTDGDFPTPNINWSLTNATIETDGARINNTVITGFSGISQLLSGTLSNKQFILTYDVVATNGQNLVLDNGTSLTLNTSTTGVGKELYFEWTRGDNYLVIKRAVADTDVSLLKYKSVLSATKV